LSKKSLISPLAVIEEGAIIDDNVSIAPYAFVSGEAVIRSGTTIAQGACIYGKTTIGQNNKIFSHAVIGSIPQDLKFNGEEVELIIGDNNTIREFCLFNPGTKGGGSVTKIGSNNLFMGYVHVGHDVQIGDNCIFANAATLAGHVEIGDHVVIGGLSPVHQFCKIGSYAMLAGGSVLTQDLPPFCMAEGNRATLRGLNLTGLRRNLEKSEIDPVKSAYKELFKQGRPLGEVAKELLEKSDSKSVKEIAEFVVNTKRGINYDR
jgi:UDP-N-acetylglucosamine acyltransferase